MRFKIPKANIAQYRNVASEKGTPWVVVDYAPALAPLDYCPSYHVTRSAARGEARALRKVGINVRILRF